MSASALSAVYPEKLRVVWQQYQLDQTRSERTQNTEETRNERIPEVRKILEDFLADRTSVEEFRELSQKEAANHNLWGFIGQGQMLLNQLVKYTPTGDKQRLTRVLKNSLPGPKSSEEINRKISEFVAFVTELKQKLPTAQFRAKRCLAFLTYFWEKQDRSVLISYPSLEWSLKDLGLLSFDYELPLEENYQRYCKVLEDLQGRLQMDYLSVEDMLYQYEKKNHAATEKQEEKEKTTGVDEQQTAQDIFLLARTAPNPTWPDIEGKELHFGSNVANYLKVVPGAYMVFDKTIEGRIHFLGFARLQEWMM